MENFDRNDEIRKKAEELAKKIKETEVELEDLRESCRHKEYFVKNVNASGGSSKLRKLCKFCEKEIGFPTEQDLKDNGYM